MNALLKDFDLYAPQPERLHRALERVTRRISFYKPFHEAVLSSSTPSEALRKLPILGKQDLVSYGHELFDLELNGAFLISETSGTTGGSILCTPRSSEEMNWNSENLSRVLEMHVRPGVDKVAILHPVVMSPFADACCIALVRQGVPYLRVFSVPTVCDYQRILRILRDYRVTTVLTTPTLAAKLCFEQARLRYSSANWAVQKFLLTGELLTAEWKACLTRVGNGAEMRAFVYGSSESASCMFGCSRDRYHPVDDFVFELLPIGDSKNLTNNLVITWLNTGIRPLVRYRTDDFFEVVSECTCGGGLAFEAHGRETQIGPSSYKVSVLEGLLLRAPVPVYHYELTIRREGSTLGIFVDPGTEKEVRDSLMQRIASEFPDLAASSISINPVDHLFMAEVTPPKLGRITDRAAV